MKVLTTYFEKNYEDIIKEPDWEFMFFKFLPDQMLTKLVKRIKEINSPFKYFLQGLQYEFGISKKQKYKKAYQLYEKGLALREPFACYRLFFIHKKNSPDFSVSKNLDLAVVCLIFSCLYSAFIPGLYKIDPKYYLAYILDIEDEEKKKTNFLISSLTDIEKDEILFLTYYFNLCFPIDKSEALSCLANLEKLCDEAYHPMAMLVLAEFYQENENDTYELKNEEKSEKYFKRISHLDIPLIKYRIAMRHATQRNLDKSLLNFSKGIDLGFAHSTGIFLNTHIDFTKNIDISNYKFYLKGLFDAILFGNINCLYDLFAVIKFWRQNKFEGWEKYLERFISFVLHNDNIYKIFSTHEVEKNQKYIIPYFSLKFNLSNKGKKYDEIMSYIEKSSEILERHKCFIFMSIAKKEKKIAECKKWFQNYMDLIKDAYINNPIQCDIIYKYEKFLNIDNLGKNCLKKVISIFNETDLFYMTGNFDVFYIFWKAKKNLNVTYSLPLDKTENLCIVCLDQPKSAVFVPCAHRCCCQICGEKIFKKDKKCPVCTKEIVYCLNKIYD